MPRTFAFNATVASWTEYAAPPGRPVFVSAPTGFVTSSFADFKVDSTAPPGSFSLQYSLDRLRVCAFSASACVFVLFECCAYVCVMFDATRALCVCMSVCVPVFVVVGLAVLSSFEAVFCVLQLQLGRMCVIATPRAVGTWAACSPAADRTCPRGAGISRRSSALPQVDMFLRRGHTYFVCFLVVFVYLFLYCLHRTR